MVNYEFFKNNSKLLNFLKKKIFLKNNNKITFFYTKKNLLKKPINIGFYVILYYYFLNNNKVFINYFNKNFIKFYRIGNTVNFLELHSFNIFTNFFKFFRFGTPYMHLFYYRKEKVSRWKKSKIWKIIWNNKAKKYVILDEFEYTKLNFLNNNLVYLNFNYLFYNNLFCNFFNKFNSNLFKRKKIKIKKKNWLKYILIYKRFLLVFYKKKILFLKDFSKLFWKKTLKYWFEYFIIVKNNKSLFNFFKFFKIRPFFFIICISSFLNSKYFLMINLNKLILKSFDEIYDCFLKFLFKKKFFKKFFNFFLFLLLTRWVIFNINHFVAYRKIFFSIYGKFQHLDKLHIYFHNLLNDTTEVDKWLKVNNICGLKFSSLFSKILFILDWRLNLKRRPWHSFYLRFFDILKMIKNELLLKKNKFYKVLKVFYRIFLKFMYFVKKNKHNFKKKSFKSKPIRYGVKVYL